MLERPHQTSYWRQLYLLCCYRQLQESGWLSAQLVQLDQIFRAASCEALQLAQDSDLAQQQEAKSRASQTSDARMGCDSRTSSRNDSVRSFHRRQSHFCAQAP